MNERKTPRPATAEVAYAQNLARLEAATRRFHELVAAHRARQQQRPLNWGDAGDVAHAAVLLEEINAFLCSEAR